MGRYSQARRRGSSPPGERAFQFPPPAETEWGMDTGAFEGEFDTTATPLALPVTRWGLRYHVGADPYTEVGPFVTGTTHTNTAGPGELVKANVRWTDAAGNPLSDWSTEQSVITQV